jgi:hypothetical protein
MRPIGSMFMILGIVIFFLGVIFMLGGNIPWLGRLPGDIRITRPGFRFYFPVTTSIILSIVISFVLYLLKVFR